MPLAANFASWSRSCAFASTSDDTSGSRSGRPAFVYARGDARAAQVAQALPGSRRVQTAHFDVVIAGGPVPLVSLPPAFVP